MAEKKQTNETILETVRRIEDGQAGMDRDMEKDRQNLQNLSIRLEAVESELSQLRKAVNQNSERTRNKVAEAIEPVISSTNRLTTQIQKKKMVILKQPEKWWKKFFNQVKKEVKQ